MSPEQRIMTMRVIAPVQGAMRVSHLTSLETMSLSSEKSLPIPPCCSPPFLNSPAGLISALLVILIPAGSSCPCHPSPLVIPSVVSSCCPAQPQLSKAASGSLSMTNEHHPDIPAVLQRKRIPNNDKTRNNVNQMIFQFKNHHKRVKAACPHSAF
jgi:hypothetical protein